MLAGTLGYDECVALELDADKIPTVTNVRLDDRRKQDNKNLGEQIVGKYTVDDCGTSVAISYDHRTN